MNDWLNGFRDVGHSLFGRESSGEMWALIVVCTLSVFLVYKQLSVGFVGRGEKSFLTLIPGVLLMAAAAVTVRVFLNGTLLLQLLAAGICFLILVLPLTARIEKTGYFNAMVPWVVAVLVLTAILYLEPLIMNTFQSGAEKSSLLEQEKNRANAWDKF